ncbi:MAG: neutral/alkaline non-lysosomal ceramidase N-terminal domain-containing protein [Pirellulaceae bacterium]|nr:neutral/alkaline non-lysosomal ceramidase N-terminal domain-containing protein [Pirellulaceae bacterium]
MTSLYRLALTSLVFVLAVASTHAADTWRAGVAKTVITPERPMWMAGYASRDHVAEGKSIDLMGKALVLEDPAGAQAVLITLDLVGIDRPLSQSICAQLEKKHGLLRDQVAINCSHTHSGPVVARNLRPMHYLMLSEEQKKQVDDYSHFLENKLVEIVGQAIKNLAPANITWGSGKATFAVNRRTNVEAKVPELRAAGLLKGPVDHDVPVLAVRAPDGKLIAVAFGYACHATVLSLFDWSGDYPGFAQLEVEKTYPDCVALFWAGCGGDQNPLPRRTVDLAKQYGRQLAKSVAAVVDAPMRPIEGSLKTSYQEVAVTLDKLPTKEQLEQGTQSKDKYIASRAKHLLEQISEGTPLAPTYPYPVSVWKVGPEVQWVFLGGEVVIDYPVRLKSELTGTRTWVAGYSNDVMAYIPSRRVLMEGGYEGGGAMVYYGLPSVWGPEVEETIVKEVHRQAK